MALAVGHRDAWEADEHGQGARTHRGHCRRDRPARGMWPPGQKKDASKCHCRRPARRGRCRDYGMGLGLGAWPPGLAASGHSHRGTVAGAHESCWDEERGCLHGVTSGCDCVTREEERYAREELREK